MNLRVNQEDMARVGIGMEMPEWAELTHGKDPTLTQQPVEADKWQSGEQLAQSTQDMFLYQLEAPPEKNQVCSPNNDAKCPMIL